jgi:hypothetical protein
MDFLLRGQTPLYKGALATVGRPRTGLAGLWRGLFGGSTPEYKVAPTSESEPAPEAATRVCTEIGESRAPLCDDETTQVNVYLW